MNELEHRGSFDSQPLDEAAPENASRARLESLTLNPFPCAGTLDSPDVAPGGIPEPNPVTTQPFDQFHESPLEPGMPGSAVHETRDPDAMTSNVVQAEAAPNEGMGEAPSWTAAYAIPGMEGILREIQSLERSIHKLKQQKAELMHKVDDRARVRDALLAGCGASLKQAVAQVFSEFGVSMGSSPEDRMDAVLEHRGRHIVVQIVASEGEITLADIRQLNHRVEEFIEVNGRLPKGLLIASPYFQIPLTERDLNGHLGFPEELRLLAEERYRFCLLTPPQLFVAYCKFKAGNLDVNEFFTELLETVWVYGNHRDYQQFNLSTARG